MRRSADALKALTYVEDKNSGEMRRLHHIDLKTGMYRGRQVSGAQGKLDHSWLFGLVWKGPALRRSFCVRAPSPLYHPGLTRRRLGLE